MFISNQKIKKYLFDCLKLVKIHSFIIYFISAKNLADAKNFRAEIILL